MKWQNFQNNFYLLIKCMRTQFYNEPYSACTTAILVTHKQLNKTEPSSPSAIPCWVLSVPLYIVLQLLPTVVPDIDATSCLLQLVPVGGQPAALVFDIHSYSTRHLSPAWTSLNLGTQGTFTFQRGYILKNSTNGKTAMDKVMALWVKWI